MVDSMKNSTAVAIQMSHKETHRKNESNNFQFNELDAALEYKYKTSWKDGNADMCDHI